MRKPCAIKTSATGIHIIRTPAAVKYAPACDFLERFVTNQSQRILAYMDTYSTNEVPQYGDNPFRYQEKDIVALQAGAMLSITPNVMHDMYIERRQAGTKGAKNKKNGRVDFWAHHKMGGENHDLFFEMKHFWASMTRDTDSEPPSLKCKISPKTSWKNVQTQISNIEGFIESEGYENPRRIAFGSVFFYAYEEAPFNVALDKTVRNIHEDSFKEANWVAAWELPKHAQCVRYKGYGTDDYTEYTPFIGFYALIEA